MGRQSVYDEVNEALTHPVGEALRVYFPRPRPSYEIQVSSIREYLERNAPVHGGQDLYGEYDELRIFACLLYAFCPHLTKSVQESSYSYTYSRHDERGFPIERLLRSMSYPISASMEVVASFLENRRGLMDIHDELVELKENDYFREIRSRSNRIYPGSISEYQRARAVLVESEYEVELAYSSMSTRNAIQVRGIDRFTMASLGVLSSFTWAAQVLSGGTLISVARAAESTETSATAAKSFVPPLGLPLAIWVWMVVIAFAVLIVISISFLWKGYFAPTKSERAAKYIEHFGMLVLGAFFGHAVT